MRVALISSRYSPEASPSAKRASDLTTSLRSASHRVTVLTQLPSYPDPAAFAYAAPEGRKAVIEEDDAGDATWRFAPRIASKGDLAGRLMSEGRFARLVSRGRTGLSDLDGVIASTPFVFNLLAARSYHVPMWLDVRDLTWEYARTLGRRSTLKTIGAIALRTLALSSFRAARGISTTTDGQRRYLIDRGVSADKLRVVPNGVPRSVIDELIRRSAAAPNGSGAPLKIVYAGLLGFTQGLEFVVESMEDMAAEGVELHLYGDGVDRRRLEAYRRERDLRHVYVHGHVPYDDYLGAIATADVLLASLRPEVQMAEPSKILEYMAAGKPVVFVGSGEGAAMVEQTDAGVSVGYGDRRLFRERLRELARDATLRRQLGASGRRWVCEHRVREEINRSWVEALEEVFENGKAAVSEPSRQTRNWIKKPLRRVASVAVHGAETSGFLRLLERTAGGQGDRLRVLAYHRVTEGDALPGGNPGLVSANVEGFARQMAFLGANYRVVSVEDVLDTVRNDRSLPSGAVLLTFDDAYCDFAENAWPILKRQGLPVTLFVPTGYPDNPECSFWWDRLYETIVATREDSVDTPSGRRSLSTPRERLDGFRSLRDRIKDLPHREAMELVDRICRQLGQGQPAPGVLGWDALRSLAREGVALGAHTRTHPVVDQMSFDEVRREVSGSMEDLKREIGSALPIFAYPAGRYNDQTVEAVSAAGIELAFTTRGGVNDLRHCDRLRLRRIHVGRATSRPILRAQLLGMRPPSWLKK